MFTSLILPIGWILLVELELFGLVQAGVDLVAELVGVTLGPKGRNVVLQNKYGPPKIVNDGETVLKEVNPCSKFWFKLPVVSWRMYQVEDEENVEVEMDQNLI